MMLTFQEKIEAKVAEEGEIVRWLITLAVSLGALLEVIDTSIVNVALPFIKGNLGSTLSEAAWVITSYSMANAVMIPLTAWLGDVFGRKGYFVFSLIGFTLASVACGLSPNLTVLVLARVAQGLFGGGLLAKAQSILFETFPREKQGLAQGVFGVCVIVGPILGPTLGGYLTDALDWRWIFFINIPFGVLAVIMCSLFLPEDGARTFSAKVDWLGIGLLTLGLSSLQYVLEKGQDDDWFASHLIITLSIVALVSLVAFVAHELTIEHPAVDLRVLKRKSVSGGVIYSILLGMGLYGTAFAVPNFAQSILGFTATNTGFLQLPGSLATGLVMPIIAMSARKIDARLQVALGAILTAVSMFLLAHLTATTGADDFLFPLILRGVAIALMYIPLTLASIGDCQASEIPSATGFMNLSRQLGGSVGIAILTTMLARREDFHRAILVEKLTSFNSNVTDRIGQLSHLFSQMGSAPFDARAGSNALLNAIVTAQATLLSFEDIFWFLAALFLCSLPVVLLLAKGTDNKARVASAH